MLLDLYAWLLLCVWKLLDVFSIFKNIWKAWRCKKLRNALIFVLQPQRNVRIGIDVVSIWVY